MNRFSKCFCIIISCWIVICSAVEDQSGASGNDYMNQFPMIDFNNIDMNVLQKIGQKKFSTGTKKQNRLLPENLVIGSVDENSYLLGSGDGITIYLWGTFNDEINAVVDNEGNFLIPTIGIFPIKGLTLLEAKKRIKSKILQFHKGLKEYEVTIFLSEIRQFRVYILGQVTTPGSYVVNGATRVSDLVDLAGGFVSESLQCLRGVEIANDIMPKRYADLAIFYHANTIQKNPYLLEGDRVFFHKRDQIIQIHGAVLYPGKYDYMPNDSLYYALLAAGGLSRDADSTSIIIKRFVNNGDSLITLKASFKDSSVHRMNILRDDRIMVNPLTSYRLHRQVVIKGEVKVPGIYPIQNNKTLVNEIIDQAGGLTQYANLSMSKIVRRTVNNQMLKDIAKYKQLLSVENLLSPTEKVYLKSKLTEEDGRISIDFNELIRSGGTVQNIILQDNDSIFINRIDPSIKVMGAVLFPGLVQYQPQRDIKFYVEKAGGYSSKAVSGNTYIIRAGTEEWLRPSKVKELKPGDTIWIPEKPYINTMIYIRDILVILSSIATIISTSIDVNNNINK